MNASEYRNKSVAELNSELITLLREQFNLRMQKGVGQAVKPNLFIKVKRNIARIKTILKEKGSKI